MAHIADGFDSHDAYVDSTTDWARLEWHGVKIMTAAELREPCKRPGCTCPWTQPPAKTDEHNNVTAREGVDRCWCGSKYWKNDKCVDCGTHINKISKED